MTNAAGTTLTALFADGDGKVCSAVGLYAQLQQDIQVTVAGTGRQVLERLREKSRQLAQSARENERLLLDMLEKKA